MRFPCQMTKRAKFVSKIYKIGINPVVDPPEEVLQFLFDQAGREKGPIPVRGKINGADYIQTLMKYQGAWRLYINGPMLQSSGLAVGDTAEIEIEFDPRPRDVKMVTELAAAFKKEKRAHAEYEKLSPSRQKEILKYIGSLKSKEARKNNINKLLRHLKGEVSDSETPMMWRHVVKTKKGK